MIRYRKRLNENMERPRLIFQRSGDKQLASANLVGWKIWFYITKVSGEEQGLNLDEEAHDRYYLEVIAQIEDIDVRYEYEGSLYESSLEAKASSILENLYQLVRRDGGFTKQTLKKVLEHYVDENLRSWAQSFPSKSSLRK